MMRAAEGGMRRRGTRWAQTGRCRGLEPGEQEVERGQLEAEVAGQAGPGFLGLAGYSLIHLGFLCGVGHLADCHPVVV